MTFHEKHIQPVLDKETTKKEKAIEFRQLSPAYFTIGQIAELLDTSEFTIYEYLRY